MSNIAGTFPAGITPIGFQKLTVSDSAVDLTVPVGASRAVIGVEAQPLRWRDDATDPDASTGMLQAAGDFITLYGSLSIKNFKAIKSGATDSVLNIAYYK